MFDLIVCGAGPAGITAAVYAARQNLKTLVISENIGGQAALSGDIENYTGFQFITGPNLAKHFEDHLRHFDVELNENQSVSSIEKKSDLFRVNTGEGSIKSRTVVVATGGKPRRLGIPGEAEFKNKGLTYCAICDGPIFSGKEVAVVGGGNSALDATLQLTGIASKVHLITLNREITGDSIMIGKVGNSDNVEIHSNTKTLEVFGETFVSGIKVEESGSEKNLDVQGVFIEIGWVPNPPKVKFESGEILLDKGGAIKINEHCETSIPGLYAAGDVSSVPERQIIVAAGQGCIASLGVFKYLSTKKFN